MTDQRTRWSLDARLKLASQWKHLDWRGEITCDVACRGCGYNLRGLGFDRGCPECGAPIAMSLRRRFEMWDEGSLGKRLAQGVIVVAIVVIILVLCAALIG
ncbi:MAG: hypothetical protein CMJ18_07160 [Phycisphaeraceae bacterium]|nr:hypothetical protein [Phycisphaeraceae bacterium]